MTYFDIYHRKFELKPQRHKLLIEFEITTEQVFETLERAYIETKAESYPNMMEPIFKRNFWNPFNHKNGTTQRYHK